MTWRMNCTRLRRGYAICHKRGSPQRGGCFWGPSTTRQVIPVYSQPPADDVLLRAYDKCPALRRSLRDWHTSAAFVSREASSAPLRETVAAAMGLATPPTLEEWYNTYDWLQLRRLGELQAAEAAMVPVLEPAVWAQVRTTWREGRRAERGSEGDQGS